MKRCTTLSPRRATSPLSPRRASRFGAGLILFACLFGLASCVTSGTHQGVVRERDRLEQQTAALEQQVERLEVSTQSLQAELGDTLENYEDLNVEHEALSEKTVDLERNRSRLASALDSNTRDLEKTRADLTAAATELARLNATYDTLVMDLEEELASGQIEIEQLREGIRLAVSDEILFASGSAKLDPIGRGVLIKVIDQLKKLDHRIEVQGHTDNRGISGALAKRYPSNWELASARASRVVRLMQQNGIEGERMSVSSFASFRPMAANDSPENRALNRRIEIRLKPDPNSTAKAAAEEPPTAGPPKPAQAEGATTTTAPEKAEETAPTASEPKARAVAELEANAKAGSEMKAAPGGTPAAVE